MQARQWVIWAMPLLITLFVVAAIMYGLTIFMMARMLTRPPRLTDARALARLNRMSPADIGLDFETCNFIVRDERTGRRIRLAAWWIEKQNSDRCAILIHGYADAKVGAIAWAPLLCDLGWNVLAVDLRGHGESDCKDTTAGYFERYDLSQLIDQLRSARPRQTLKILLFGISMGAAVAAAVADLRPDVHSIILESPYAHFRDAAREHANMMGLPGLTFIHPAFKIAQRMTHARFDEVDPLTIIPQINCPVLIISARQDVLVRDKARKLLQDVISQRKDGSCYREIDAEHVLCLPAQPEVYRAQIEQFLNKIP